ncbi:type IV secretory pathway TraG/TraD family ATPase VirD4 [Kitasatospora sp. MAA19]|uniref:type IV secretory system conjugative DNA transfer family protein n=1 Tax=unclassified Kitasatospora TaxID=2633591 RepID=UPI002476134A|nr:type IV secretory system conjugative DNA transfer family protein [Kitasatospora sp. MAA19]MDH6709162.1 type IV secretory pathway TraG/TraD family ATPase VirD4 [Kitasatospora sp. MAA19]
MPAPRTGAPSTTSVTDALLYLLVAVVGAALAFGTLAWLTGNLTNYFFGSGPWAPFHVTEALLHPHRLWPHLGPAAVLVGARVVPGALTLALTGTALAWWLRRRAGTKSGMARPADIAPLLDKEITAKARSLRPSLRDEKDIAPAHRGIPIGTLSPGKAEVRASWEDVMVAIMAPRSGKTSGIAIPAILSAPGPVLLTSNKAANDAFTACVDARAKVGKVWTLDPQQIAHHPREMWWDILADARDLAGAKRLAGHFVTASVDESSGSDFWSTAASNTLGSLFLAAASHRRPITDVLAWLASPSDRTPVDLLTDAGHHAVSAQLQGTVTGATETRDGIYETARQYASCLLDPEIAAWVTPTPDLAEFKPFAFASSRDTLFLLSKDGGGSASAIIAAAADAVMRAAVIVAERNGGRLDPPALCVLDEAANVCKISDLPDLYSHLGSRGVIPITILQSYRQGQRCWGAAGMDALWSAATVKVIGSGIDDADFADKLSRQIGEHDVQTVSVSDSGSGKSTSVSMRTERILPPDEIRALPKGKILLFATGMRVAMLDLKPWYKERSAKEIGPASARATKAITERALAKSHDHDGFGLAA